MGSNKYKVQQGDTLGKIVHDTGTPMDIILKLNPEIKDPNLIFAGQELKLYDDSFYETPNGETKAPTTAPAPTIQKHTPVSWLDTEQGKTANQNRIDREADWNTLIEGYKNRPNFEYDFNADALYQQYKDKYIKQGKMAMADTIGQASAMTGGYGNSYAQSVGNQAYQASLENLNDVIPELYQMAYDRYNQKGQEMLNAIGLAGDALNRADSNFYNDANLHSSEQSALMDAAQKNWENEFNIWDANNQTAWKQAEWDEAIRQWQAGHELSERQVALQEKQYEDSKTGYTGGGDNSTSGSKGYAPRVGNYDNGSLSSSQVKALQEALGVDADGYYGSKSKKAAGGLSAAEAYKKFVADDIYNRDYSDWDGADWESFFAGIRNDTDGGSRAA